MWDGLLLRTVRFGTLVWTSASTSLWGWRGSWSSWFGPTACAWLLVLPSRVQAAGFGACNNDHQSSGGVLEFVGDGALTDCPGNRDALVEPQHLISGCCGGGWRVLRVLLMSPGLHYHLSSMHAHMDLFLLHAGTVEVHTPVLRGFHNLGWLVFTHILSMWWSGSGCCLLSGHFRKFPVFSFVTKLRRKMSQSISMVCLLSRLFVE